MTLTRTHPLITITAVCISGIVFVGLGGLPVLARAVTSSLEFVGHLISSVHHISLDQLEPTYPRCF